MPSFNVLITGANRGIGLGLVKQFLGLQEVTHLFAACRTPPTAKIDEIVGAEGLNLLINNAAIGTHEPVDGPDRSLVTRVLDVNTISPLIITQTFLPLLRRAANLNSHLPMGIRRAAVINISSGLGSITENSTGSMPRSGYGRALAYRVSKAALNAISKALSIDLKKDEILVISQCPGWVQTDMGGEEALLTVDESTSRLLKNFFSYGEAESGGFFMQTGEPYQF